MNYITRHTQGTMLHEQGRHIIPKGIILVLNQLAIQNGSTLQGRLKAARELLQIKHTPPIYINDDIILLPTASLRHPTCVCINICSIESIEQTNDQTKITFHDQTTLISSISLQLFRTRNEQAWELSTYLNRLRKKESVYSIVNY